MTITYEQAFKKATEYLSLCSGFQKGTKLKLFKTDQQYNKVKHCQELTFVLDVYHSPLIDMDPPITESEHPLKLINLVNHDLQNIPKTRFFKTDFYPFARCLIKELGYNSDYTLKLTTISQRQDTQKQCDTYNISIQMDKTKKYPEIVYESAPLSMIQQLLNMNNQSVVEV